MPETLGQFQSRLSKTPIGAAVDQDVLIGLINDRVERVCRSTDWSRLEKDSQILTLAEYNTGTISIDAGATSGTGDGTTFTSAMTGREIRIAERLESYIFTQVSATAFTIDRAFEGEDDLADVTYRIFKSRFELPADLAELYSISNPSVGVDLEERSREWLDQQAASRIAHNDPTFYTPAPDSSSSLAQVQLYPNPIAAQALPLRYRASAPLFTVEPIDTSEEFADWISVPCVYAGVLADLYRLQDKQQQAAYEEKQFMMLLAEMQAEDARRKPPERMKLSDRYTEHRRARIYGGRRVKNWNSASE